MAVTVKSILGENCTIVKYMFTIYLDSHCSGRLHSPDFSG